MPQASAAPVKFDIPAQPAATALQLFGQQASVEVVYPASELKTINAAEVKGELEPAAAIERLLKDTGYAARQTTPTNFAVARVAVKPGSVSGSLLPSRGGGGALAGVTVTVLETGARSSVSERGNFKFPELPPGTYTLGVSGEGFSRLRITDVVVRSGVDTTLGTQELPALRSGDEVQTMKEVVVSAKKEIETLAAVEVSADKMKPFSDRSVDLPRTMNDVQAYYIFDAKTLTQSGAVNTEDFLKQRLSMNTNARSVNQGAGNSFGQTSSINLRGIGLDGTLILVNGRERAGVAAQLGFNQADLNGIPMEAIDRIEVLPSSASAIYGGNAIGGVVNVILKSNYSGGSFKATYENTTSSDAPIRSASLTYGLSLEGGKTQVSLTARYSDGKPVFVKDRPEIVVNAIKSILRNSPTLLANTTPFIVGATPNILLYPAAFAPPGGVNYVNPSTTALVLKNGTSLNALNTFVPAGTAPGANIDAGLLANAGRYNTEVGPSSYYNGLNGMIGWSPARARSLMGTVSRKMTSWLEAYAEYSLEGNLSISNFGVPSYSRMAGSNPNNPFRQNIYVTTPVIIDNPDVNNQVSRTMTAGLKASLPFDWRAQMDYSWSRSSYVLDFLTADTTAIEAALQNGSLNPFVDTTTYPLSMEKYRNLGHQDSVSTLNDLGLRLSGPLARLPWGNPTLTFGVKRKLQGLRDGFSSTISPLTPATNSSINYFGHINATESAYAEANLPIVTARNSRPLLRELEFQLAGRADRYTVDTGTSFVSKQPNATPPTITYFPATPNNQPYSSRSKFDSKNPTIGFKYKPFESVTARASYATAFLPPTFSQLVPAVLPGTAPTTITDPKTNATYGVQTLTGGNPSLKPKRSKSLTAGVIFEPRGVAGFDGLRLGLEYYKITQLDYITTLTAQQIVSGGDEYAARITRDATTGRVTLVNTSFLNVNEYETSGFDLSASYHRATPLGAFDVNATGTLVGHEKRQFVPGGPFYEYVGYVPEGGPVRRKGNATVSWQRGRMSAGWTASYFDGYKQYGQPGGPIAQRSGVLTTYTAAQGGFTIPSQIYHDAFASYAFPRHEVRASGASSSLSDRRRGFVAHSLAGVTLQAGVKNVFNKAPPFDAFYSPWYYSPFGDPRLRRYWLSVQKDF